MGAPGATQNAITVGPAQYEPLEIPAAQWGAVVAADVAPLDYQFPIRALVGVGAAERWAWVWGDGQLRTNSDEPVVASPGHIALSRALAAQLGLTREHPAGIRVTLPVPHRLEVRPALSTEVVGEAIVRIPDDALAADHGRRGPRRRLLVANGLCIPVQAEPSGRPQAVARIDMRLRMLCGVEVGDSIQLSPIDTSGLRRDRQRRRDRHSGWIARPVNTMRRRLDLAIELLLRALLRSPPTLMRTTQAPVGDDAARVVRLQPSMFASLGIAPGMQVFVEWSGLQAIALALEDYETYDRGPTRANRLQGVGRVNTPVPADLTPHLVARLSLQTRQDLGIPAHTVVQIRRRLRPLVLNQLNQLTIPAAGIFLAGVAVDDLRGWPLAVGLLIVLVFGLAPLRRSRPPSGIWP